MPGDYDTLGTGTHTGNYAGFYVDEDVTLYKYYYYGRSKSRKQNHRSRFYNPSIIYSNYYHSRTDYCL